MVIGTKVKTGTRLSNNTLVPQTKLKTTQVSKANMTKYYVATSGSDSNTGLSLAQAFASLKKAAQVLVSGDEVEVGDGTYTNQGAVDINGKANFAIYASADAIPRLQFSSTAYNGIQIKNSNNFSVRGLDLTGYAASIVYADAYASRNTYSATYSCNGIFLENCYKGTIQGCYIQDFPGSGITAEECDYITLDRNQVRRCTKYSPYGTQAISFLLAFNSPSAVANVDRLIATRNVCIDNFNLIPWSSALAGGNDQVNEGNGIYSDTTKRNAANVTYTGKVKIDDNVCVSNGASGIHALNSAPITVSRNFVAQNSRNLTRSEVTINATATASVTGNFICTDSDRNWLSIVSSPSTVVSGNTIRATTAIDNPGGVALGSNTFQ